MSSRVTRGTYRRSCRRCGWEGTYDTAGRAAYARRRHSCEKNITKAEAAARGRARMDQVDRTPKPCHHKQANHQHGTNAAYVLDKCRCAPCAKAVYAHRRKWELEKAYGRYDKYVSAAESRVHVLQLMSMGMGLKQMVRVSDVSQGLLWKLVYGKRKPDGTQVTTKRVLKTTHERIMAIEYIPAGGAQVDGTGTRLRLRALVAIGYSITSLGRELGLQNIHRTIHGHSPVNNPGSATVLMSTHAAVLDLYDRLSMTPNTPTEWHLLSSANRARRYAQEHGWLPPLALDEEAIDTPGWIHGLDVDTDEDLVDEVVVQRRLDGQKTRQLTNAESVEVVRRADLLGITNIEKQTGVNVKRVRKQVA